MNIYKYETKIGKITIGQIDNKISNVFFENDKLPKNCEIFETDTIKNTKNQIVDFLAGEIKQFNIDTMIIASDYTKMLLKLISKIPYGHTMSYKELAKFTSNEKAYRAVANACNKNPLPIIIPCHRVIGSSGDLIGYRGGLKLKEELLSIENEYK